MVILQKGFTTLLIAINFCLDKFTMQMARHTRAGVFARREERVVIHSIAEGIVNSLKARRMTFHVTCFAAIQNKSRIV